MLMIVTHEPLSTCINPAHVRGNIVNECRVVEFDTRFACEVYSTLVNTCYQCSSSQYACCHRTPEKLVMHQLRWFVLVELQTFTYLVGAEVDCNSNCPKPKSHT